MYSCEKALETAVPETANNINKEHDSLRSKLIGKENSPIWYSNTISPKTPNAFFIGFKFDANNRAVIQYYRIVTRTIVEQLREVLNDTNRSPEDRVLANSLINSFAGFSDALLRQVLNDPANESVKTVAKSIIAYDEKFGSIKLDREENSPYTLDGFFDSNISFSSKTILSDLKSRRLFDFDFNVVSYDYQNIELYGLYPSSANRNVRLKRIPEGNIDYFLRMSAMLTKLESLGLQNVKLRWNGTVIDLDSTNVSWSSYLSDHTVAEFLGLTHKQSSQTPSQLQSVSNLIPTQVFQGNVNRTTPAGTVLILFNAFQQGKSEVAGQLDLVIGN